MRRRELLGLIGGTAAGWPRAARAQQQSPMPVLGLLVAAPGLVSEKRMTAFRQGLAEVGYVEGRNVLFLSLGADGMTDRLPGLAAELVGRQVSAIVAPQSSVAAVAAHDATKAIPIIFSVTDDPVRLGLVTSLARPGGNATGVKNFSTKLAAKRLGLVRELLPTGKDVAILFNPATPVNEAAVSEVHAAAGAIGLQSRVVTASTSGDMEAVFARLANERPDAVLVIDDPFFSSRNLQLVLLSARHAIPGIYSHRELAEIGGPMSYGASLGDVYRQLGVYTGRILKGEKPAELPVQQSTKFELVINLSAARTLGLAIPPTLLARADEVIE
jgi:putative tryptophan/tyrosine transport system substrate-binding protein